MTAGRKKIITIIVAAAVAATAAAAAGFMYFRQKPERERREDPQKYAAAALSNTWALLNVPSYDSGWIFDMLDGRHELELGLAFKEIDLDLELDRQALSMAQLARLDVTALRDVSAEKMQADITLAGGGAELFGAGLYMSADEMAVKLPQGFDYFITVNPRRLVSEWDGSILGAAGSLSQVMTDDYFYGMYKNIFGAAAKPEKLRLINDTLALYNEAEYGFTGVEDGVYSYSLRVKADSFNTWFRSLVGSLASYETFEKLGVDVNQLYYFIVTGDLDVTLDVKDEAVTSARITTLLQDGVSLDATVELRGEANPFDDVFVKIDMKNPNGAAPEPAESFSLADAVNRYIMIEEMPPAVSIEITHTGDSQNPTLMLSEAEIVMSAEDSRTEIGWSYSWDQSGDSLDNFKLDARVAEYTGAESAELRVNASGTLLEDREKKELLSNFNNISWHMTDFDENEQGLGLTLKLNLKSAPDADIGYDKTDATALTELSPLQLMKIYANFKADPLIGGLMQ